MPVFLPVERRRALAGALLLVVALVLGARHVAGAGAPAEGAQVETVALEAAGGSASAQKPQLVVHVVGAVRQPGLYELDEGSRVADAVAAAGGATARADVSAINLASPLADGLQIVVPVRGAGGAGGGAGAAGSSSGPIHLNSASVEQLDTLPGIGPATAQKIVEHREKHGAFRSVDDLDAVPGIGPARLEQLRELVAP